MKAYALLLLLLVLALPVYSQEVGSNLAIVSIKWGTSSQSVEVGPGSVNAPLTIQLLNRDDIAIRYAKLTLSLPEGITSTDDSRTAVVFLPTMNPGTISEAVFYLNIDKNLKTGVHQATLYIEGVNDDDTTFLYTTPIQLRINGEVSLHVSNAEKTVMAGRRNSVNLILSNNGTGTASEVEIVMSTSQQVSILSYPTRFDKIDAGESVKVPVEIYVAPSLAGSPVTINVAMNYLDSYGNPRTVESTLGYEVAYSTPPNLLLEIIPNQLTIYNLNDVKLRVTNAGFTVVRDVALTLSVNLPLVPVGTDGKFNIPEIRPGETAEIPVSIYVSETSAPSSPVTVSLSYLDDSNQLKTESRVLNAFLSARSAEFLSPINLRITPNILYSGTINNITVSVSNIGSTTLRDLTITPSASSQATWLQENTLNIPSLEPGEEYKSQAAIFVASDSPTSITLAMTVSYYGRDNVQRQEERQIGVLVKGVVHFEVVDLTILPEVVSPGQTFSVTIVLVNTGTVQASAVSLRPSENIQGFRLFGQSRVFLGNVPTNTPTSVTFSFTALNSTSPGRYQLPLVVSYRDNVGEVHTDTLSADVNVKPAGFGGPGTARTQTTTANTGFLNTSNIITIVVPLLIGLVAGVAIGRRGRR
ncbi:MAG: hypothetical protein QXZ71_00170 [Candidatus Caldarchaeum sp.]